MKAYTTQIKCLDVIQEVFKPSIVILAETDPSECYFQHDNASHHNYSLENID